MNPGDRVENTNNADGRRGQVGTLRVFDPECRMWMVRYDRDGSFGWVSSSHIVMVQEGGSRAFYFPDDGEDCR